jgi:two-component system heavy metal sensor histidine kinase CusS
MRRWPLTTKVSVFAALLTIGTTVAFAVIFLSFNHRQRLLEVDHELYDNARELLRDLRNFRGSPLDPRRPLSERFIPIALRERLVILTGPEGQVLYASPGFDGTTLGAVTGAGTTVVILGERFRVSTEHEGSYTVELGINLADIDIFHRDQIIGVTLTMPLLGILVFAGAHWMSRRAISSVTALTEAAEHITVENLDHRLPAPPANDEVARLTRVLNDAFSRLQAAYEAASRFSADASHQMKTPVAVLRLGLELLRKKATNDEAVSMELDAMLHQVRRLASLMDDLLLLARVDARRLALDRVVISLGNIALASVDDLDAMNEGRFELTTSIQPDVFVSGDPRYLSIILQNLTENAAKYTPTGGTISVAVSRDDSAHLARFAITNSGPPIPKEDRALIFERFRRGSLVGESSRGHGLGLNIACGIARAHGGCLALNCLEDQGAQFVLTLPAISVSPSVDPIDPG